jgi:predicted naringenin-chalcone synthase
MPVYINNIATAVPTNYYKQDFLRERMKEYISEKRSTRSIIHRIYSNSGIDKRHSVIQDFHQNGDPRFFFQEDGTLSEPTTGSRNSTYAHYAKELFVEVAQKLIDEDTSHPKEDITHIITASCTGFFAPEPAYEIVKQLGLSSSTQRYHLGFMGCFAAFPALKMAESFIKADPNAKVLVICLELCTLHLQNSEATDHLISASVFGDGASGALLSSEQPLHKGFRLEQFATTIAEESEKDMAWTIGDTGFDMVLSTYVPDIIESNLKEALKPLFETYAIQLSDIQSWAIHPGGKAILDKIEKNLNLKPTHLKSSRNVLSKFGNMSSATILFVLQDLLENEVPAQEETTLAMAFGPGLTIESALFTKLNNT